MPSDPRTALSGETTATHATASLVSPRPFALIEAQSLEDSDAIRARIEALIRALPCHFRLTLKHLLLALVASAESPQSARTATDESGPAG